MSRLLFSALTHLTLGLVAAGCGTDFPRAESGAIVAAEFSALRFVKYNQPSAYHADFWDLLDLGRLDRDFALLRSDGFNGLAVPVPFGSFVTRVDAEGFEIDDNALEKLTRFLDVAERHSLVTVLWFNDHRLPDGVGGTAVARFSDPAGVEHPSFVGFYADGLSVGFSGDHRWRAFLGFCAAVAHTASGHNVLWDPLDWQYALIHPFQLADAEVLAAWQGHLRRLDPDLAVWRQRWREPLAEWEDAVLPVSQNQLDALGWHSDNVLSIDTKSRAEEAQALYSGRPVTPPESAKWTDYGDWRAAVIADMWREVIAAVRSGSSAPIGLRVDIEKRANANAPTSVPPGVDDFDVVMYQAALPVPDPASLREEIQSLAATTGRPTMLWETVMLRPDRRQTLWADTVALADDLGVGLGLWAWRDNYFNFHTDRNHGLRSVDSSLKQDRPELHLLDVLNEASIEPSDVEFETPTGGPAFAGDLDCGTRRDSVLYTVAPSEVSLPIAELGPGAWLHFDILHPWPAGDGVTAAVVTGGEDVFRQDLSPRIEADPACDWSSFTVRLPPGATDFSLETRVAGDASADWVAWRKVRLVTQ